MKNRADLDWLTLRRFLLFGFSDAASLEYRDGCNPVQDRKDGKVSLEGGIHLGAVEHGFGIFPVGHFLLRERGTEDILG